MSSSKTAKKKIKDSAAPEQKMHNAYTKLVHWFSDYYELPYSHATIVSGLPDDFETRGKSILPRLFEAAGFKSSFVLRKLREIDPIVLPCVLLPKKKNPLILLSIDKKQKIAEIVDFDEGSHSKQVTFRELQRQLLPEILLVTENSDFTASGLDKHNIAQAQIKGHWLWRPVLSNWSAWLQIIIAAFAINLFGLALPIFVMNVYDRVIPNLAFVTLWTLAIGVTIALCLDFVMKLIRTSVLEVTSRRIDLQIASNLYRHALGLKILNRPGGSAGITNQIREFEAVRDFFASSSFIAIIDLMFIGLFVGVLWIIVGPIALVPLLAVPIVILLAFFAQIPIGRSVEKAQQLATKRHVVLVESLLGHETVKSVNAEPVMQREWENAVAASARINGKTRFWGNVATNGTMLVQQGVSVIIIIWGVYLVSTGSISIGGLIAANILAGRILAPLGNISQTLIRAQQALKSMASVSALIKLPTENDERPKSNLKVKSGSVEFKNVSFTYPESPAPALADVSFAISPGETVALLGRVGSGKSTMGRLFAGLMEPDNGLILVDGKEIKQYDSSQLREGLGYLPQDPDLFTGTIRENLTLGHSNATDEELNEALYYSGMDYFIAENPEGLNQFVGEKGNRLSGGQRQSIGLARLLLRKPKMLFLDEPTNAMDSASEHTVINRLQELSKTGVGMILCTHRQSLAQNAQRYIVIDKGNKVLDGLKADVIAKLSGKAAPTKPTTKKANKKGSLR